MLALLLINVLSLIANGQYAKADSKTWIVDDDGTADFDTMQEAINAAKVGDTVLVRDGTYRENVVLNKSISLLGENPATTMIDGGSTASAIRVTAENIVVKGFTLQNVYGGFYTVYMERSSHSIVEGNVFHGGFVGVFLYYSNDNIVSDNEFSNIFDYGILLGADCSNNIIRNNVVKRSWYGIGLWNSSNNIVYNNTVENTGRGGHLIEGFEPAGILLYDHSRYNEIIGNDLSFNDWNGIAIAQFSTDNSILNSVVSSSEYYGVWVGENSSKNVFQHNLFNNQNQTYIENGANVWDDGEKGNYWSNYNGSDTDGNGVGDAPYEIDANNVDRYPLVNPWIPVPVMGDVNHDGTVNILDVVMASSIYGHRKGEPGWNEEADVAAPYGAINLIDLVTICASYGKKQP